MKTLKEYSKLIIQYQNSGDLMAELLTEISSDYAYLIEQHIDYKLQKAFFEDNCKFKFTKGDKMVNREKPLSDKSVETKWRLTEIGEKEYEIGRKIKALEKLMKNLNTIMFQKNREASV